MHVVVYLLYLAIVMGVGRNWLIEGLTDCMMTLKRDFLDFKLYVVVSQCIYPYTSTYSNWEADPSSRFKMWSCFL